MKVPLTEMYINEEMKDAAIKVIESGQYINGPETKAFEREFAKYMGAKYAISVSSGTSALFITFMNLNLKSGDEIIVPSLTFIASASQAIYFGAKPVFVDVDPHNYTMNINEVRSKITKKTKAIVAVHIYGHPVDMDPLMEISREFNIKIIEDCAQAHNSRYKGKMVGIIGDYGCFSFFPSKIMNVGGDGGIILTNDYTSAQNMAMLKNHGRKEKYLHEVLGVNMRLSEIQAAIGRAQLKKLPFFIKRRKSIVEIYNSIFKNITEIQLQKTEKWADPVYYVYTVQIDNRKKFIEYMEKKEISTGIHYPIPLHRQPVIEKLFGTENLPISEKICQRILSIPLSPAMSKEQIEFVISTIQNYFKNP